MVTVSKRAIFWTVPPKLALLLAVSSPPGLSLANDLTIDRPRPVEKTSFSGEDAPAGIRLKVFLMWYELEQPHRDDVIMGRLSNGGFPVEAHETLLRYFQDLRSRIEIEVDSGIRDVACHGHASELSAVEVRAVFNAIDDLRNAIYAKYVAIASSELATFGYVDFPDKLEAMATSFTDVGFDYRAEDVISDEKILESRRAICNKWN